MADININDWVDSISRHLKRRTPTIPRVPERIRMGEKDAYEPRIISVGPYHHGEPRLHAMEEYKWSFTEAFFFVRPRPRQSYIDAIKEEEANIRACYTDNFDIGSEQFVEMILNDGCFLVGYFIQCYYNVFIGLESVVVGIHELIQYDILLLENQLPFFILIKIFDLLQFTLPSGPFSFMDLAINYLNSRVDDKKDNFPPPEPVHHLLHLFHSHCLYSPAGGVSYVQICGEESGPKPQPPSVTVLHEAGVKFEKKEVKGSSSLDVTFDTSNGKMMIPPLVIDTDNMSILRNLVAYEQFYPNFSKEFDKSFTAYVEFMDFIVNTPADVALLHKRGIIRHFLGSDKNAAIFFNDLNREVYVKPDHYLAPLYEDVYNFMQKRRHKWHATLIHNHCNSPWAVLGIVVGGILLVFTLLQTIFSGISAF